MKFNWNKDKNELLKSTRSISFEDVLLAISQGKLLEIRGGTDNYPHQKRFIININNYPYVVPFFHDAEDTYHLITIMADRKLKYLIEKNAE